ncbi:MAG: SH3 domain-containing protein [Candidatus Limivicinus sp.]
MRKFVLRTLVIAAVLCMMFTVTAYAENAVITGSDVNFRSGPGTGYNVIDCLAKGTTVTVNDRSNASWYGVNYNGQDGFISSSYLSVTEETDSDIIIIGDGDTGYINAMYVRLRSGPSTSSSILGEYNTGTSLTINGTSGEWTSVTINGKDGYVYSTYVSKGTVVPAPTPEPTPAPTPEPTPAPSPVTEETGYINGDYVRFRTGPSTSDSIIDTYNKGKELTITGTSGDWTAVTIDGKSGYVYSQYVTTTNPNAGSSTGSENSGASTSTEKDGYIKGNNVRFRSDASMSASILGEYNYGTALKITGVSGDWTAVTINGQAGFVYSQYVAEGTIAVTGGGDTSDLGNQIAQYALQYVGYPYVWGGTTPAGFDCSGFVQYVYKQFGYTLNRIACDQALNGVAVDINALQPGDVLCFYSGSNYIGHVGIYIGDNKFVHASTSTTGVIISELSGYYYNRGFIARRIV